MRMPNTRIYQVLKFNSAWVMQCWQTANIYACWLTFVQDIIMYTEMTQQFVIKELSISNVWSSKLFHGLHCVLLWLGTQIQTLEMEYEIFKHWTSVIYVMQHTAARMYLLFCVSLCSNDWFAWMRWPSNYGVLPSIYYIYLYIFASSSDTQLADSLIMSVTRMRCHKMMSFRAFSVWCIFDHLTGLKWKFSTRMQYYLISPSPKPYAVCHLQDWIFRVSWLVYHDTH